MIKTIAIKELLLSFNTIRFVVIALVTCLLVPVSVAVLSNDYISEKEDYESRVQLEERSAKEKDQDKRVFKPVPELSILFRGVSTKSINGITLQHESWNQPVASATQSPTESIFPVVDLTFIVGIVLSALAIILSFDAVSGEKTSATLRLIMTTTISRTQLITGKWLGLSLALIIPYLLGLVISLLLIVTITGTTFSLENWLALAVAIGISCIYLSLFVLLGIFISIVSRNTSQSIFMGLGVWGLLVILLPNILSVVANSTIKTPSFQEIEKNIRIIHINYLWNLHKTNKVIAAELQARNAPREETYIARRSNEWPLQAKAGQEIRAAETNYWNQVKMQENLSRNLSLISPMGGLTESLIALANTGTESQRKFMTSAYRYGERFYGGIYKDVTHYPTDEEIAAMPDYQYQNISLPERINSVILPLISLMIILTILYFGSVIFMSRYDVR